MTYAEVDSWPEAITWIAVFAFLAFVFWVETR